MLNRVTLIGHLGRKPELRNLESGVPLAQFSVATNENYRDKEGNWQEATEWHRIVAWRDMAVRADQQLDKGVLVLVEGKLVTRKYTDKDGIERSLTEIEARTIKVLDRPNKPSTAITEEPAAESEPPF
jgi:single-strand DNA-binding protein